MYKPLSRKFLILIIFFMKTVETFTFFRVPTCFIDMKTSYGSSRNNCLFACYSRFTFCRSVAVTFGLRKIICFSFKTLFVTCNHDKSIRKYIRIRFKCSIIVIYNYFYCEHFIQSALVF